MHIKDNNKIRHKKRWSQVSSSRSSSSSSSSSSSRSSSSSSRRCRSRSCSRSRRGNAVVELNSFNMTYLRNNDIRCWLQWRLIRKPLVDRRLTPSSMTLGVLVLGR